MARSTTHSTIRAGAGKTAPATRTARGATPGRTGPAQEAIAGFIRTLEKLDASARPAAEPTRNNKAAAGAPEAKARATGDA